MIRRPVNLIEDKLTERTSLREQAMRIVATCLLGIMIGCILTSVLKVANTRASGRLQAVMAQRRVLDQRLKHLQGTKDRQSKEFGELRWAVEIRDVNRKWRGTLFELGRNTPQDVYLNQVVTENTPKGESLKVAGAALSLEQVAMFINNLSRSPQFGSVQLESTQSGEMNGSPIVSFRCYVQVGAEKKQ